MSIKTKTIANIPTSVLVAFVVTALLFIAIPLLTKISTMHKRERRGQSLMISQRKPPPPPEPEMEEKLEEMKKREAPRKSQQQKRMPRPSLNIQSSGLTASMGGTIAIGGLLKSDFEVSDSLFVSAFKLTEVDQKPRIIRQIPPRYPFEAQQKGIEGRVIVRFVVDSTGAVKEPEIKEVEPKEVEGYFEEAALACIMKFKFKPAQKGGEPVDCIVNLPLKFSVNE
jgi:periplasmic protein TonB